MYDPRIARFFAVDPLTAKYPFYTPYSFSGNRVIDMVELEGLEPAEPKSGANTLVIVIVGYNGANPPEGQTQTKNNGGHDESSIGKLTNLDNSTSDI